MTKNILNKYILLLAFLFIGLSFINSKKASFATVQTNPETIQSLQLSTPINILRDPNFQWGLQWQNNDEPLMEGNGLLFSEYLPIFKHIDDSTIYNFQYSDTPNVLVATKTPPTKALPKLLIATCGFDTITKYPSNIIRDEWTTLTRPSYLDSDVQSIMHLLHDVVMAKANSTITKEVTIVCDNDLLERNGGFDDEAIRCIIWNNSAYDTLQDIDNIPLFTNTTNNFLMLLSEDVKSYHLRNKGKLNNLNNTCIGFSSYEMTYDGYKELNYGKIDSQFFVTNIIAPNNTGLLLDIATIGFKKGYGDYKTDISGKANCNPTPATSLHQMLANILLSNKRITNKSSYPISSLTIVSDKENLIHSNAFNLETYYNLNLGRCVIWNNSSVKTVDLSKKSQKKISYNYFYIDMNNIDNRDALIYDLEKQLDTIRMIDNAYYQLYVSNGDKPYVASSKKAYNFIINKLYEINPTIVRIEADLNEYKKFIRHNTLVNALKFNYNINFYHYGTMRGYANINTNLYCKLLSGNETNKFNNLQLVTYLETDTNFVKQQYSTICHD